MSNQQLIMTLLALQSIFITTSLMPEALANSGLIETIQTSTQSIVTISAQRILDTNAQGTQFPVKEQIGAGVIIDPRGFIVTNTHIILYADYVFVTLSDGNRLPAQIVSIAPETDFSILKIYSPIPLKPLAWTHPDDIHLGKEIISIGNTPLWKQTICAGTISGIAKNISYDQVALIEMDLSLDRGDSGGPVLDRNGRFLGLIIAKNTKTNRAGYAIPAWHIQKYFSQYQKDHTQ